MAGAIEVDVIYGCVVLTPGSDRPVSFGPRNARQLAALIVTAADEAEAAMPNFTEPPREDTWR